MKLIDGDELIELLLSTAITDKQREYSECVQYAVQKMPTVDAVPVRHGEWIEENTRPRSGVFYCSSCHRTCYDLQPTRLKGWTKRCRYAFCPNCGADMRKDGDHEAD